ncbi:VOC family protein [Sphingomonas canadensis]|uniref:VOC family protein n=1 Tax=Sphingomonas canadensis TaxID=1219257 RepID=A0ABW3HA92_9SPHN|nr:VOC family protein [Sphingomonas canadensis]MCW3836638.1 VOC family protein [Sphingomonas canadensis]
MEKITPVLWYDMAAEEAAVFYTTLLPDSRVDRVIRAPSDNPSGAEGSPLVVDFTLAGRKYAALNGGPLFKPNESVSFQILTDDQAETDRLWDAITGNGGVESMCGWCKDRWGFSWQITPRRLIDLITDADPDRARRASQAMLKMRRIDIATIEAAADGAPSVA